MRSSAFLFFLMPIFIACSRGPSPEQAQGWLTEPESWRLKEVSVNGSPVYRDGKVIEQFGGLTFNRYMKSVIFHPDGKFEGSFEGDSKVYQFSWIAEEEQVIVRDTLPNSGIWKIPYRSLSPKVFDMETETNAYDPPNPTRIRLQFTAGSNP